MTAFIPGLIVGFILAFFVLGLLIFLVALHKPRYSAPTLRRKRDVAPGTAYEKVPAVVKWEAKATDDERGINYSFMGATGLEE
jgi:hypothetical protein